MYSIIIVVMENEDFIWVVNETEHFDPMPMTYVNIGHAVRCNVSKYAILKLK